MYCSTRLEATSFLIGRTNVSQQLGCDFGMMERLHGAPCAAVEHPQGGMNARPIAPRNFDPARRLCLPASKPLLRRVGILIPERSTGHRLRHSKGWAKSVRRCEIGSQYRRWPLRGYIRRGMFLAVVVFVSRSSLISVVPGRPVVLPQIGCKRYA